MRDKTLYRILESVPALLTWSTLLSAILLAIFKPVTAMIVIIIFDLYWFLRISYLSIYLFQSWNTYKIHRTIDWYKKLELYENNPESPVSEWKKYYHLVFIPTYRESISVLEETFLSLSKCSYPSDKILIVLAGEKRDETNFLKNVKILEEKFRSMWSRVLVTLHPDNIPGEIAGKGSNIHWAGQRAEAWLEKQKIHEDFVIVSTFDCDTQPHPQYFAYLSWTFLHTPDRYQCSYQPMAVYFNNHSLSTPLTRVVSSSTTFWLLSELSRPERLLTFSSHSMSWKALRAVGFWQPDIVTEDTRIFLQCWLYYRGEYRTVPLFIPVSMSTVDVPSLWQTIKNQYKQMRRWGWGVEHMPYLFWNILRHPEIQFSKRFRYLWNIGEGMYTWATAPLIILILGYIPFYFYQSGDFQTDFLVASTPVILEWLMRISLIGVFSAAYLMWQMQPPLNSSERKWSKIRAIIVFVAQWLLVPVSLIFFGSLPALDAQTRLALGKYLGFWVAPKRTEKELLS